ncbi:MAG: pyridoxal-phosphate dependent enzyme [Proteobacteria bacterium]|nr:pyridoxal-phosphate dependent enzyme [Pseudomonadota bacterium]
MNANLDPAVLWEDYHPSSVVEFADLARHMRVAHVSAKLENERPLGNFKALGGMVAGLRALARLAAAGNDGVPRLICASDGNHGLSVAAAAARAGGKARIYLPACASPIRAERIEAIGGEVLSVNGTYDDAVNAAAAAAARGEGLLIPDTSPDPNDAVVKDVMAGYALITKELRVQLQTCPTHVFVQAGVGGLAAAVAEGLHDFLSGPRRIVIVEPASAACVSRALAAGQPVSISGTLETSAEMLSCGLASASAIEILKRHNVDSIVVSETQLEAAVETLRASGGPQTTPSGAAGLAGLLHVASSPRLREQHQLTAESSVLFLVTEGTAASPSSV